MNSQQTGNQANWKMKYYLIGAVGGLLFGLAAAYLFARAAEDEQPGQAPKDGIRISTGELVGISLALLGIMRQIAELGRRSTSKDEKGRRR
ncbi:MAG: hypothetical protein SNJ59_01580 [Aggregatilineales bacterium]